MKRYLFTIFLLGSLFIAVFVQKTLTETQPTSPVTVPSLPITAQLQIDTETIDLEVAATPQQQQQGLMYRTELAQNRGMLFIFNPPRVAQFWMKNTLIPLDMIFLKDGRVKAVIDNVPPCRLDPCETYGPVTPVDQVIELAAGRAKSLGIQQGDRLKIVPLTSP